MKNILEGLLRGALAEASKVAYRRSWALFDSFRLIYNIPPQLPLSVTNVALFVAFLVSKGYKPATITSYMSALGYVHKLQGMNDPTTSFVVLQLLKAYQKQGREADTRLPIDKPLLGRLLTAVSLTVKGHYEQRLFQAMFTLAFHAFLRVGEITKRGQMADNPHLLLMQQIQVFPDMLIISFSSFKHSNGEAFQLRVRSTIKSDTCAVRAVQQYLLLRGRKHGPLFLDRSGNAVARADFDRVLRKAVIFNRIDPAHFKGHSFRIGAATAAAEAGIPDSQIRELGRWKSDAFKKYIRAASRTSTI